MAENNQIPESEKEWAHLRRDLWKEGKLGCASSEGWRVQREIDPPRQKPEAL
jgi:hypothetical protein